MIESTDTVALKDLMTVATPIIKTLVETLVVPKIGRLTGSLLPKTKSIVPDEDSFNEYFHRTYKKLVVVNTLVFKNSQRFLSDIYMPLTLTSAHDQRIKETITGFPTDLSNDYQNILITDTAGMGKSTLMKTIFIDAIFEKKGIPIFIELRRLNRSKKLIQEIQEQLSSLKKEFDLDLLMELLALGDFIIILDGYDEISLNDREIVSRDLQEFIAKAGNNKFFMTSRPENALAGFGNFHEFKIEPLTKKEAFELLRKYDNRGTTSKLLIKKLEERDMQNIEEFLVNPLLVSLLFTAFEHKQAIPFKKYLFYRQVYDANFEAHDLTKGDSYIHDKYSKLEIDDFHRVLRHIGFNCFKRQRIEFSKDELLKLITEAKGFCAGLNFNESDFLQDIIKTVPLFAQDGNYYKWSHKSLQEYFTAQFIYLDSKEKQNEILIKIYNHTDVDKFINILDLYYDMDYKTFRNIIELQFLQEYITFYENNYNTFFDGVASEHIENRKEIMFLFESFLFMANRTSKSRLFEDGKLSEMVESCEKQYNLEQRNFSGLLSNLEKNKNIFCLHHQFRKAALIPLFGAKKNNIVKPFQKIRSHDLELRYSFKEEYKVERISDDINCKLNSPDNFYVINELVKMTRTDNFSISNENAKTKYELIKIEMQVEAENNFSLGDF